MPGYPYYPTSTYSAPRPRYAPAAPQSPQIAQTYRSATDPTASGRPASAYTGGAPSPYPTQQSYFTPTPAVARSAQPGASSQYQIDRLRQLAGPLADILAPQGGEPIYRKDIPLLEAGLNYQNVLKAEQDRQRAFEEMARARGDIGMSPEEQLAKQIASTRAGGETPWNQQFIDQQTAALKDRAAIAREEAIRQMEGDFARRGIGGATPIMATAALEQQGLGQLSGQLGDLAQNAATQRDQAERAALEQLLGITQPERQQRLGIDEKLADLFSQTERAPFDLSGLIQPLPTKVGRTTLTENQNLVRTNKDLLQLPKDLDLTKRPDYLTEAQFRKYQWKVARPAGVNDRDWRQHLEDIGALTQGRQEQALGGKHRRAAFDNQAYRWNPANG